MRPSPRGVIGRWRLAPELSVHEIVSYYRTADRVERYLPGAVRRRRSLASIYRTERRYFGHRVLDLACGGGILGFLLEQEGHDYVGVDLNPDMIRAARSTARRLGSHCRFLRGDAASVTVPGPFDTVTLLGNALGHLRAEEYARLLSRLRICVRRGAHLIVDYRDTVAMFYRHLWQSPFVETHKGGTTTHRTRRVDFGTGEIHLRASRPGSWTVKFTQKIWSPFIVAAITADHGWELVERRRVPSWRGWRDVYRFRGRGP